MKVRWIEASILLLLCSTMATFLLLFISVVISVSTTLASSSQHTYIVHVTRSNSALSTASTEDTEVWYKSFLPTTAAAEDTTTSRMIHTYNHVATGFAARLTESEVTTMSKKKGFVAAYPDKFRQLLTTRTPGFLSLQLQPGNLNNKNNGAGIIIGVLDSGITPGHPSFSGVGMPPPPSKWKGRCDFNSSICNNKLIGARTFLSGATAMMGKSEIVKPGAAPVDGGGHGTHTSSTAAGAFVNNANVLGQANGTASGMAPGAHIAMYKVCADDCADSDILAAMDAAIADGVDILSISLGGSSTGFYDDAIALGGFAAIQKGIFVSTAAGNSGPNASSLSNDAPWLLTVAASTLDRNIRSTVKLGNGVEYDGETLFQPHVATPMYPLVYAGSEANATAAFCGAGSLDTRAVTGRIVVCKRGGDVGRIEKGETVKAAGGVGMILMNDASDGFSTLADAHVLPASQVSFADGSKILTYINQGSPTAQITFKGTLVGTTPAPAMASFSSRGPSLLSPGILKPDITGPGVSILAAWPFPLETTPSTGPTFNIISGTSMSTPHLSGIAALIKSAHPDWSPAAIKSAMMTTAKVVDNTGKPIKDELLRDADLFATGAGHVVPEKATDPGLVYDIAPDEYVPYLCGLRYTNDQVGTIVNKKVDCSKIQKISQLDLNYPSFSVLMMGNGTITTTRTLKNVGDGNSTYDVRIEAPTGVAVVVEPKRLQFSKVGEELKYKVTFSYKGKGGAAVAQGSLCWVSGKRIVRSPVSLTFKN